MSCHTGRGSCGAHSHQSSHGCGSQVSSSCGHESQDHSQFKTAGFFLHKIKEEIEENFEALHEEIEELEDKVNRLEKALGKR